MACFYQRVDVIFPITAFVHLRLIQHTTVAFNMLSALMAHADTHCNAPTTKKSNFSAPTQGTHPPRHTGATKEALPSHCHAHTT